MPYDSDMDLDYADDAISIEVELEIVNANTGESASGVCDNLTNVIYFIVAHGLKPVREAIRSNEGATLVTNPELDELASEHGLPEPSKVLKGFREQNSFPGQMLWIQCHGNPRILDEGL